MNLDDLPKPTLSVGLDVLYAEGTQQKQNIITSDDDNLSLQVNANSSSDGHLVVFDIPSSKDYLPKQLELQNVDFMGPSEIVKSLFALPYSDHQCYFALHKMGNTLLIDSVVSGDTVVGNIVSSDEMRSLIELREESSPFGSKCNDLLDENRIENQKIDGLQARLTNIPSSLEMASTYVDDKSEDVINKAQTYSSIYPVVSLHAGSPYLPPPIYFIPNSPQPRRQVLLWQLHEMRLAVTTDLAVYRTETHPAITIKPLDTSRAVELSTCLDLYLDNVMANVPELAICMHAKGFIRGIKVLPTEHIPFLVGSRSTSSKPVAHSMSHVQNIGKKQSQKRKKKRNTSADDGADANDIGHQKKSPNDSSTEEQQAIPMFDPKVIDFNASTILRFLKDNCSKDDGTYIVSLSPDGGALHLYDLGAMSVQKQKRWKWMLAMVSYRFAVRLGHHIKLGSISTKVQIRHRQKMLFTSCYQLLGEIRELGGESHGTIRASVLEQIADIHLSRVDDYRKAREDSKHVADMPLGRGLQEEEEGFDIIQELQEALLLLQRAVSTIDESIRTESISSTQSSTFPSPVDSPATTPRSGSPIPHNPLTPVIDHVRSPLERERSAGRESIGSPGQKDAISLNSADLSNLPAINIPSKDNHRKAVLESLMMQLTGVFHKVVLSSCTWVDLLCRDAKTGEAVEVLGRVDTICDSWIRLRLNAWNPLDYPSATVQTEVPWSERQTLLAVLPMLWERFGSLSREMARQLQRGSPMKLDHGFASPLDLDSSIGLESSLARALLVDFAGEEFKNSIGGIESFAYQLTCNMTSNSAVQSVAKALKLSTAILKCILGYTLIGKSSVEMSLDSPFWPRCHQLRDIVPWILVAGLSLSVSTLLLWSEWEGPSGDPCERARFQSFAQTPRGSLCLRRVAEICSACGQRLLELTSKNKADMIASAEPSNIHSDKQAIEGFQAQLTDCSEQFLSTALTLFGICRDSSNEATVLCNLCSLLRFKAMKITESDVSSSTDPACGFIMDGIGRISLKPLERTRRSNADEAVPIKVAMRYLDEALSLSNKGHSILGQRGGFARIPHVTGDDSHVKSFGVSAAQQERIWDAVSYESGCVYLCIGVILRDRYFTTPMEDPAKERAEGQQPDPSKLRTVEARVLDSLGTALRIFTTLRSERQTAAAHFHLGAMHMVLSTASPPTPSPALLSAPAGHSAEQRELALSHYGAAHGYYAKYDVGPTLLMLLTDTMDIYLSSFEEVSVAPKSPRSAAIQHARERELVTSMLGGAYHVCLESKCVFTAAVLERHGAVMAELSKRFNERLARFVLLVLQRISRKALLPDPGLISSITSVKELKELYKEMIQPPVVKDSGLDVYSVDSVPQITTNYFLDKVLKNDLLRTAFGSETG